MGHSLFGLAIATVAIPRGTPKIKALGLAGLFILFANNPDWPFPYWGHDRYEISHSFIVTAAITFPLLGLIYLYRRQTVRIAIGLTFAWFSHIILDSTYNHGLGLSVLWPLSDARLAMPLPWFETLRTPVDYFTPHSIRVMSIEFLAYGIVLTLVVTGKIVARRLNTDH